MIIVKKLLLKIEITCSLRDSNRINKSSNPISKDIEAAKVLHMFEYLGIGILSQGDENDVREGCA